MKSSRSILPRTVAIPASYDSFFSFPIKKSGYSGVATYTRTAIVTPLKAEEGLTGLIQPKPALISEERVSCFENYPPQLLDDEELDYKTLDSEGRAVTVDFGLFVLINTYCPNDGTGTEERDKFKMDYHRLLEARVKGLIEEGREVIVLGDINSCAAVIDHCEGNIMVARGKAAGLEGEEGFWEREYRRWLRDWLQKEDGSGGPLVDVVRRFWPDRKGMYTCESLLLLSLLSTERPLLGWNTKISARETNYGTRIDYILVTPGLLPWIKAADVQQDIKGSDHCPVFVDFHHEITNGNGVTIKLHDVLGSKPKADGTKEPPRLAAKFWEEFSGKQMLLDKFFGKNKKTSVPVTSISPTPQSSSPPNPLGEQTPPDTPIVTASSLEQTPSLLSIAESTPNLLDMPLNTTAETTTFQTLKRKLTVENYATQSASKKPKPSEKKSDKKAKNDSGQPKLSSFFNKPTASQTSTSSTSNGKSKTPETATDVINVDCDDDDCQPSQDLIASAGSSTSVGGNGEETKQVWNHLLAPVQPPKCIMHGEPAKEYTVNKPGPNKGKKFWICSR